MGNFGMKYSKSIEMYLLTKKQLLQRRFVNNTRLLKLGFRND